MLEKCFLPPPVIGAIRSVSGSCVCKINLCCATGWPWRWSLHVAWRGTRGAWNKLQQPPKLIQSPFSTAHLCGNVHLSTTSQLNWWTRSYPSQCNTSTWQNILAPGLLPCGWRGWDNWCWKDFSRNHWCRCNPPQNTYSYYRSAWGKRIDRGCF